MSLTAKTLPEQSEGLGRTYTAERQLLSFWNRTYRDMSNRAVREEGLGRGLQAAPQGNEAHGKWTERIHTSYHRFWPQAGATGSAKKTPSISVHRGKNEQTQCSPSIQGNLTQSYELKRFWHATTCMSLEDTMLSEEARHKRTNTTWAHSQVVPGGVPPREAGSRQRGQRLEKGVGNQWLMQTVSFCKVKKFWRSTVMMAAWQCECT